MINRFALFQCFFLIYVVSLLVASIRIDANELYPQVDYLRCEVGLDHHAEFDQDAYDAADILDD